MIKKIRISDLPKFDPAERLKSDGDLLHNSHRGERPSPANGSAGRAIDGAGDACDLERSVPIASGRQMQSK